MTRTGTIMLAALALGIAGCAGSGKSGSPSTAKTTTTAAPPLVTHRQFVKALDFLCRRYNRKLDRFYKRYASVMASTDYAAIAKLDRRAERLGAPWRPAVGRLQVPRGDERRFRRYLALSDRISGLGHREIPFVAHQDRAEDRAEALRLEGLIAQARNQRTAVAVDMGLQVCGS